MKKLITLLAVSFLAALSVITPSTALAAPMAAQLTPHKNHVAARLRAASNSGVEGFVNLRQLKQGGTHISLIAFGLQASHNYVSLYYSNHACNLEPYEASDVIGGIYTANSVGVGLTHGTADDNLDQINSVSVRDADTFNLLACADVHP